MWVNKVKANTAVERLVHAFVTSHLDYCSCLFAGLPNSHLAPLQRIQNTAARLVTRTKKSEHITPVLQSLNWLSIHQRICFKVLLLVYKIYHKLAPAYLQDLVSFRSTSISSSTRRLVLLPLLIFSYVLVPALLLDTAIVPSLQ